MTSPTDLIGRIETIGTVPTSVAQIFSLISDPRAAASDFERVVRPDVGLTANLLRCANSVFYRASREITSVKDAINRMGLRRVFEIAASGSFANAIPPMLTGYGLTAEAYWEHSVAVAVLSDRIGRAAGFTYPDLAFTAGLLHDLGKVVVATFLSATTNGPVLGLVSQEQELLGTDHTELGSLLAAKWNLPKEIAGAARWHHDPEGAPTATLRYLSTVVQVADGAAHTLTDARDQSAPLDLGALERLTLEPGRIAELVEAARPEIERTTEMLKGASRRAA
jgi:putative nucleotidyltransferase with HDIG domain